MHWRKCPCPSVTPCFSRQSPSIGFMPNLRPKVLDNQPETQNESCRLELDLVKTLPVSEHGGAWGGEDF